MKNYILILSILAFSIGISLKAQEDKVIVIVNSGVYSELQPEIDRYVNDISKDYKIELFETNGGAAEDLKDFIISQKDSLVGCIFIGSMPVCWFEIENDLAAYHPTLFPCDLFYMDLDGLWSDEDYDGNYDTHTNGAGDEGPDIFLGRIDASEFSDEINLLRKYFNKDHTYWTGGFHFRKTGLTYTDDEWKDYAPINEQMSYLYGMDNYQLINDDRVGSSDYLLNRLPNNQYEFIQIAAHSTSEMQGFYLSGQLWSDDILNTSPKALGYNLFACSACDYTKYKFIGGAYIFNKTERTLVVIGSTKIGSMLQFYAFYQPLGENKSIGQAYKEWFNYIAPYNDEEKSWHYGMTILGDPLIKFNAGNANHGPMVNIGCNQRIFWPDNRIDINATIKDDGLPVGSQLTYNWETVSGPPGASFEDENTPSTSAHLDSLGDYRIKLTVSDGEYTSEDFKNIQVSRIKWEGESNRPNTGFSKGLIVRDSLAYVTSATNLIIFDIKNITNPYQISSFEFTEPSDFPIPYALAIDSDYAYIAAGQKGVFILDISNPHNPERIGSYSINDTNECINDIKVLGDIAFVTDSIRGIVILDIHDRRNPALLGYCPTPGTAEAISVQGNYAYLNDGDYGLRIYDISDKSHPITIGTYNNLYERYYSTDYKQAIQVIGNYVYISYQHPEKFLCISIIDVSDKINPIEVARFDTYYTSFYVEGNYLYYLGYDGPADYDVFGIIDITDKLNPNFVESYKNDEVYFQGSHTIFKSGQFIYLVGNYQGRGLNIFNLHLANTPPSVYTGEDMGVCNNSILLKGIVNDDNIPAKSNTSFFWEKISGPGDAYIADPTAMNTEVEISDNGEYIFRLSASDGELTGFDDIRINYFSAPPEIGDIKVCENSHVPDFSAAGENIRWYGDAKLSNLLYEGNLYATRKTLPGIYKYYVTQTISECESKADTVILTIITVPPPITQNVTVCENRPVPDLIATGDNIQWYSDAMLINLLHTGSSFSSGRTEPGTYDFFITQAISGCESEFSTINLSINPLPSITLGKDTTIFRNQNIILGPFNQENFYFWNDGSDNPYLEILGNDAGIGKHAVSVIVTDTNSCSFSDTINLNVVRCEVTNAINDEACERYTSPSGNHIWTIPGEYLDTLQSADGCDSIIKVHLTIIAVDTSVTKNADVLNANASGAAYQWLNCDKNNSPIEGENQQSFIASTSGNYAVIISQNGCTDTSACLSVIITGFVINTFKQNIALYPNPTDGSFSIDMGSIYPNVDITITQLDGRVIRKDHIINSRFKDLQMSVSTGIYMVYITSGNERAVFKILKK